MSRHRVVVIIHAAAPGGSDVTGYLDVDAADAQAAEHHAYAQLHDLFHAPVTVQAVAHA